MFKETLVVFAIIGCAQVFGQGNMNALLLSQLASGGGGAGGAGGAMGGGGLAGMMNSPLILCRDMENSRAFPCKTGGGAASGGGLFGIGDICALESIKKFRNPRLLTCSPFGIGCCYRDLTSMMLAKQLN